MSDDIFTKEDLEENVNIEESKEYDYLLTFVFESTFAMKQVERHIERFFCLLPGVTYEKGNSFDSRNISREYDNKLGKTIYINKYRVWQSDDPHRDDIYISFAFNVIKPTYKWITCLKALFDSVSADFGFKHSINGIGLSYSCLEYSDFCKFGFTDSSYIYNQKEKDLQRKIIYTKATLKIADAIAVEMTDYKPEWVPIVENKEKAPIKRFEISYTPEIINIPVSYCTSKFYKEAILVDSDVNIEYVIQSKFRKQKIEFVRIYESNERYIFVALSKPDKPRDAEEKYNYEYFFYTFWIDKGNYMTDALKLKRTLVNVFGEEMGLNIEQEIISQK